MNNGETQVSLEHCHHRHDRPFSGGQTLDQFWRNLARRPWNASHSYPDDELLASGVGPRT